MKTIEQRHLVDSLNYLFKETFEGSPPKGSIYLDRGIGVFNTIAKLDSGLVSKEIAGSTIAAHTDHLRYYLQVLNNFLNGIVQTADWNESWKKKTISEDDWAKLKTDLAETYKIVLITFESIDKWEQDEISEAMAIVVHTAYHLGAIRQILKHLDMIDAEIIY